MGKIFKKVVHDLENWVLDLKPSPPIHVKRFFETLYLLFSHISYPNDLRSKRDIQKYSTNSCVDRIVINIRS